MGLTVLELTGALKFCSGVSSGLGLRVRCSFEGFAGLLDGSCRRSRGVLVSGEWRPDGRVLFGFYHTVPLMVAFFW